MQLFVCDVPNTIVIDVTVDDCIRDIKKYIEKRSKIPVYYQNIVHQGKYLQDSKKIKEYHLQHEDTLHVKLRIR